MKKVKTYKLGNITRTVTKESDPNHYENTRMADVVYGGKNILIKKKKTVVTSTKNKTKNKVVNYSPVNYYGKQKRTVSK